MKKAMFMLASLVSLGAGAAMKLNMKPISEINFKASDEDIIMIDANGKKVVLGDLRGKVVFVNLWATWCAPCVAEMPTISKLKDKFEGNENILFVLLNIEADIKISKKFMKDRNLDLPVYVLGKNLSPEYFQGAIPTTLIFGKDGKLISRTQGARNFDQPEIFEALKHLTEQNN